MQTNTAQTIIQKIPMLSESDRQKVLDAVENLLKENGTAARPISEIFESLSGQIPIEEWRELPDDGAENHDHYLYGSPKKSG